MFSACSALYAPLGHPGGAGGDRPDPRSAGRDRNSRRALAISQGDLSVFITQPISATILAVSFLLLIVPLIVKLVRQH